MSVRSGDTAPYAPPATILALIEAFRERGLTTPFTPDVLMRAGVTESLVPRSMKSLELLDLIDADGNPTPALEGLRRVSQAEYGDRLAEIVRAAYAEVFQFADPAKDDVERISDAFRAFDPPGQRRRMVTLFVGLCDEAGLIPEGAAAKPGAKSKRSRRGAYRKGNGKDDSEKAERPASFSAKKARLRTDAGDLVPAPISGLLASLPSEDEGWTKAQRDKFVKTFETVLDYAIPIIVIGAEGSGNGNGDAE